ncbi:MAG TPA: hypothetical protein VFE86_03755 [Ilumatobacteraceae bacterium]|nr:hypothetical protein [Ilumatobacteraceae bacterium]
MLRVSIEVRGWVNDGADAERDAMLLQTSASPIEPTPGGPPPTRPLPDLPDEPSPNPQPGDPTSQLFTQTWRMEDWVPASG